MLQFSINEHLSLLGTTTANFVGQKSVRPRGARVVSEGLVGRYPSAPGAGARREQHPGHVAGRETRVCACAP